MRIKNPTATLEFEESLRKLELRKSLQLLDDALANEESELIAADMILYILEHAEHVICQQCMTHLLSNHPDNKIVSMLPREDDYIRLIESGDIDMLIVFARAGRYLEKPLEQKYLVRISDDFFQHQKEYFRLLAGIKAAQVATKDAKSKTIESPSMPQSL